MRQEAKIYLAAWKARGRLTTTWICPHCKKTNECCRPDYIDVEDCQREDDDDLGHWDSATTCVECGHLSMVKTYPTGQTEVIRM